MFTIKLQLVADPGVTCEFTVQAASWVEASDKVARLLMTPNAWQAVRV